MNDELFVKKIRRWSFRFQASPFMFSCLYHVLQWKITESEMQADASSSFALHLDVCSVNATAPGAGASSWSDKSNGSEWKDPSPWRPQRNGWAPWGVPLVSSTPVDTDLLPIKRRRWNSPLKMACLSSWGVLVGMKWDERARWQTAADSLLTTCCCCKIK